MWERVEVVLGEAFARLRAALAGDLPGIVAMLILLLSAVIVAFVIRGALRLALARVGFDQRAREWGMTQGQHLGQHHEPSWLVARGAFWFVIAGGVALAIEVLGATTVSGFGIEQLDYQPKLFMGAIILLAGIGVARFVERGALIHAVNHQVQQGPLLALGAKWLVIVLAAAMALQHCGIGGQLPTIAFAIVVGGIVLALALAVGLGARDAVARALDKRAEPRREADDEGDESRIQHL